MARIRYIFVIDDDTIILLWFQENRSLFLLLMVGT